VAKRQQTPNFEEALAELEDIVSKMEKGDLKLDQSLQAFERGIQLARQCQTALKDAEQKVTVLMKKEGKFELEPFDTSGDE